MAVQHYTEHLRVVDEVAPVVWQEYPTKAPPFELERVINPVSPRLFHANYHDALMYHQHVRERVPGLLSAWAKIMEFIDHHTATIGNEWAIERSVMNEPQAVLLQL